MKTSFWKKVKNSLFLTPTETPKLSVEIVTKVKCPSCTFITNFTYKHREQKEWRITVCPFCQIPYQVKV